MQQTADRIVAIIKADPNKERIDKIIERWIKPHLKYLGVELKLDQLNSLVEFRENLVQKERLQSERKGIQKGRMEGEKSCALKTKRETALNLIKRTKMDDAMIADIAGLTISEVA